MPFSNDTLHKTNYIESNSSAISFSNQLIEQNDINRIKATNLDAVIIRNIVYEVGSKRNAKKYKCILDKISLTVPEGSIYGLLGPSGCGKTTMLRCVVGRLNPNSGSVLVFGCSPNGKDSQVPGRAVGYMPQEISIYEDFTIEETLQYFGRVNRMTSEAIRARIDFLLEFLDLPPNRFVINLSGGQKRRVSLAAALVHSPPLLILDEPTVGVDPLLRQSIWQHLVTLTKRERISVIITTHYIEEARQANVVGLMRRGKILAEANPDALMNEHQLSSLEEVFLKLCITDAVRKAANLASEINASYSSKNDHIDNKNKLATISENIISNEVKPIKKSNNILDQDEHFSYANEAVEVFSSEDDEDSDNFKHAGSGCQHQNASNDSTTIDTNFSRTATSSQVYTSNFQQITSVKSVASQQQNFPTHIAQQQQKQQQQQQQQQQHSQTPLTVTHDDENIDHYLANQAAQWAFRRRRDELTRVANYQTMQHFITSATHLQTHEQNKKRLQFDNKRQAKKRSNISEWLETLRAVTWKNYVRLRRNPPVLVFQFMLPAVQVILFCLCIGGEPFDVPLAVVNDEVKPQSSERFLGGLAKSSAIKQIKYDNLTSALQAVREGKVWGALHIPSSYSKHLQSRLLLGDEANSETISNGTIRVYPDLTNLHLALALESTFRDTFISFARDSLTELGYDKALADLPIQIGTPIYGSLKKDGGYLEFMAPGVVISISYVMATGLTALAFILERRDGLLERSLVSGVQTSQILLAHAINQIVVMLIQIFMVLGCVFFVFEIPSRGPFSLVVLLILLQGCTGMAFGLLVSAICSEENTAVMMLVGTFYTNLILAGIIWPIEAMPHWLRPLSYLQPQTLPADTLRHILSRGWGLQNYSVSLGFVVTLGWLAAFFFAAGMIFKYKG